MKAVGGAEETQTRGVKTLLGDPRRAVVQLAVPMVVAMSAQTVYNLADAIWVSGCGPEALAAVGFYFPFFIVSLSLSVGVAIGTGSAIARRIGARDKEGADAVASHGLVIMIVTAVLYAGPMVVFARPVLSIFGTEGVRDDLVGYARIMFLSTPLFFFNGFGGGVLRSEGDAKRAMLAMLTGAGLNIVLDPLFIYVFDLGVRGAAWASLTAMSCVSLIMARWLFLRRDTFITFRLRGFRFRRPVMTDIAGVGGPAAVAHGAMAVMVFAVTAIVAHVGGEDGVAVYITGWRVVLFAILPMLGLAGAVTPVTGAAFGAREPEKLRTAYAFATRAGIAVEGGLALLTLLLAPWIVGAFTWSADTARLTEDLVAFLRVIWLLYPAMAIGMVSSALFQGVGKGATSLALTVLRTVGFGVPLAWLFGIGLEGGLIGVWWGLVAANLAHAPIAFGWSMRYIRRTPAAFASSSSQRA
jgi:putative MATE family efflux protein